MNVELIEIRDFLSEHHPFSEVSAQSRDLLLPHLSGRYFRRGTKILSVGEVSNTLYILRSGAVDVHDERGNLRDRREAGECFGSSAVLDGNRAKFNITAIEDTLVFILPGETFLDLVSREPVVEEFFRLHQPARLHAAVQAVHEAESGQAILKTRISELIRSEPLTRPLTASIQECARTMSDNARSSLLITDGGQLAGIVTDKDLRNRVLAVGLDPTRPISEIMTTDPVTAQVDGMAFELLVDMVQRNIHHVPILDQDGLVGVVSSNDLLRLEHVNPIYMVGQIAKETTLAGLVEASQRLPWVVEQLVAEDATADDIGRVVTGVGDALERRLLTLAEAELGPPPVPYAWVVLGSQARLEQGLSSDQDNAMVISDEALPEHDGYFSALAKKVSDGLAECGYSYCRGEVMATNPKWRQTLGGWRKTFATWIERPEPMAVMHSTIFFDMRTLHGDKNLVESLRIEILEKTPKHRVFLAHLAKHAVARRPPIGFFREFVLESEGKHTDTLDLKRGGVGAVVELARVYALTMGMPQVNTQARLVSAARRGLLSEGQVEDLRDALEFISFVKMRHQGRQVRANQVPDNFVSPEELSNVERRHLRDVFQVVRRAQGILAQSYPLHYVS